MSTFTVIIILGFLMIIGGISMAATPLLTFMGAGYFIIVLFLAAGIIGIIRAVHDKRYDKDFIFAILSLILGIAGFAVPGAAAMNNYALLYMAAAWLFIHGALSIITAVAGRKQGGGIFMMVIGILLGFLELALCAYSAAHPAVLAMNIGILIGFYYIEQGISTILIGSAVCKGGNSLTVLFTIIGMLTVIGGFSMMFTPLTTFFGIGYAIILLFFMNGILGIVRAVNGKCYDKNFFFAILSTILGVIGFTVPGIASMNSFMLLYLAAAWLFIQGVITIIAAVDSKKKGAGMAAVVIGVVLGVLELIMCLCSLIYPVMLAFNLGILVGFYFVVSGFDMVFIGSGISRAVAISREAQNSGQERTEI